MERKLFDQQIEGEQERPPLKRSRSSTSNAFGASSLTNRAYEEHRTFVYAQKTQESGQRSHYGIVAADHDFVQVEPARIELEKDASPSSTCSSGYARDMTKASSAANPPQRESLDIPFPRALPISSSKRANDYQRALVRFVARDAVLRNWVIDGCKKTSGTFDKVRLILERFDENTKGPGLETIFSRLARLSEACAVLWSNISVAARCSPTERWKSPQDLKWLETCELSQVTDLLAIWHDWTYAERRPYADASAALGPLSSGTHDSAGAVANKNGNAGKTSNNVISFQQAPRQQMPTRPQSRSASSTKIASYASSSASTSPASSRTETLFVTQAQFQIQALQIAELQQYSQHQARLIEEQKAAICHQAFQALRQAQTIEQMNHQISILRLQRQ